MLDREEEIKITDEWALYEKGKNFLTAIGRYNDVNKCIRFFEGDQWHGANTGDIPKVQYNFIKPIVRYKTSNLDTYEYQIVFNSNNYESDEDAEIMKNLCKALNSHIAVIWERKELYKKVRKMKNDSAVTSEGIVYFYFNPEDNQQGDEDSILHGEVEAENLNTTDVLYGNENNPDIQSQPYIIIKRRRNIDDVIADARKNGLSENEINMINQDKDVQEEAGDASKNEVNDLVLCIAKLYKKNGTVHIVESTRTVVYQPEHNLKLHYYPLVHMTWDEKVGSARGLGEVENLIPNQIETNKTLMRRAMIIKMIAYPKQVVDVDKIKNVQAINKVGATIELSGAIDNINNHFGYIQPTQTSSEAVSLQNELITTTRELSNASDIATGNINPENASGKAILAVQQASQQPLNEQLLRYKDSIEDSGLIIFDIWRVYNVEGMKLFAKKENKDLKKIDTSENDYSIESVTPELLEKLKPYIKIDITPKTAYDRFAQEQSYENLLVKGLISFEEYVELMDENSSMNKRALTRIVQKRQEKQEEISRMQNMMNKQKNKLQRQLETDAMANQVDMDVAMNNIQNQTEARAKEIIGG